MPALPITGSPDITVLDFAVLYDISGAIPIVTLTNQSVGNPSGTTRLNLCTWWYVLTTPSGAFIHQGSVTAPDVNASNWTTLTTPANSWPTPFGTPPCGQVEFSCGVPYICTLYVKDSNSTIYSLSKTTTICRPNGSTANACGSFGGANALVSLQCQNGKIYAQDNTNYTYQNILGTQQSSVWTLRYPADETGSIPANGTATNAPYVYFPIGYSGEGYTLYLQTYSTYNLGNSCSVKIQYKLMSDSGVGLGKTFAVWCNVDLCALDCGMQKFYDQVKESCGEVENPELKQKAIQVNLLYNRLLTGIIQPLCNIDVPGIIKQIEHLCGFVCDCCCGGGINIGNPVPSPNSSGGCCPITTKVVIAGTSNAPAACPNSYFPTQVYDPSGTTVIGTANSADDLVAILNANAAWAAYGTAFNQGNCQVGWYAATQGETIPTIQVAGTTVVTACQGNTQNYTVSINDLCFTTAPITASEFPLNIWANFGLGAGPQYVGNFASQAAMIAGLNAFASKPPTIIFSAGSSASSLSIFNSSCADYGGVITISADAGSANFLLYGSNVTSLIGSVTPSTSGEYGIGLRTDTVLGTLPGLDDTKHMFHSIRVGNYLVSSESDTGKIYFWDIANPLMPSLTRVIQLNAVVSGCFTGIPNSSTAIGIPTTSASWYSLYFPTDNIGNLTENGLIVCEALTGSIWKINLSDPGTGITASFQDNRLIGKCPRIVMSAAGLKPTLYFTEDGNLETSSGQSSGVTAGRIVLLDLSVFSGSGISVQTLYGSGQYIRISGASFDGANTIYFTAEDGTIISYNPTTQTVTNTAIQAIGSGSAIFKNWINTKYFNGRLYVVSTFNYTIPGIFSVDVSTLTTTPAYITFAENENVYPMNALPLGNCLVLVTGYYASIPGGVVYIYKTDGTFLGYVLGSHTTSETLKVFYNLVPVPNIMTYTPNSFV